MTARVRSGRLREVARRIAERETLSNYLGNAESPGLKYGVPVFENRLRLLRDRFTAARKHGAVEAIDALEDAMRQKQVTDTTTTTARMMIDDCPTQEITTFRKNSTFPETHKKTAAMLRLVRPRRRRQLGDHIPGGAAPGPR